MRRVENKTKSMLPEGRQGVMRFKDGQNVNDKTDHLSRKGRGVK